MPRLVNNGDILKFSLIYKLKRVFNLFLKKSSNFIRIINCIYSFKYLILICFFYVSCINFSNAQLHQKKTYYYIYIIGFDYRTGEEITFYSSKLFECDYSHYDDKEDYINHIGKYYSSFDDKIHELFGKKYSFELDNKYTTRVGIHTREFSDKEQAIETFHEAVSDCSKRQQQCYIVDSPQPTDREVDVESDYNKIQNKINKKEILVKKETTTKTAIVAINTQKKHNTANSAIEHNDFWEEKKSNQKKESQKDNDFWEERYAGHSNQDSKYYFIKDKRSTMKSTKKEDAKANSESLKAKKRNCGTWEKSPDYITVQIKSSSFGSQNKYYEFYNLLSEPVALRYRIIAGNDKYGPFLDPSFGPKKTFQSITFKSNTTIEIFAMPSKSFRAGCPSPFQ